MAALFEGTLAESPIFVVCHFEVDPGQCQKMEVHEGLWL